ncbi:hypothetical protein [Bradyrhizobium sp. HKCCYLRH3097]|uniref:hypothetical protein n=1 Tax=Bradyrhizobium sp. HKCCYLRH3097 TaxID=3420752 RepID=UPI003EBA10FE
MSEFDDIRKELEASRAAADATSREIGRLRHTRARLIRDRARAERVSKGADDPALAAIDKETKAAASEIERLGGALKAAKDEVVRNSGLFANFTDPRRNIGLLSDQTPILLMPLRIETRFKQAAEFGGDRDELWVRVYPDDIAVDSFEEALSEDEVKRAQAYWADVWRANHDPAGERAAWRTLVSGQGSGRSYYVTQTHRPLNEAARPARVEGVPTVILTVVTSAPLADPERGAVSAFWTALWRAGTDVAAQTDAIAALDNALGAERAAAVREAYRPRNLADAPPEGADRATTTVIAAYLEFPAADATPMRETGWSQPATARTLPDRLVLLGYNGGTLELEQLGKPIRSPLPVTPSPTGTDDASVAHDGDDITFGPELEWVRNFDRAVEIGMGFRVPLTPPAFRRGFDQLMVLGVRLGADADAGRVALEQLFTHHHQSKAGFSILPQGQPTNNVEGEGAAYSWREESDVSFDHYFGTPPLDPDGWFERTDGRCLAATLGLDPAALAAIPFYHRHDVNDARAMNTALWPATLGYFMESMLHPVFDDSTAERTRDFFVRHVSARGPMPTIRVGRQPYGILPATPRSRIQWIFAGSNVAVGAAHAPDDPELRFLTRLYQLLRKVEADLEPLMSRVSYIGKPGGDRHQILLDVLGLHAGSVEFQQRFAESFKELYNRLAMQGAGGALVALLLAAGYVGSGLDLLKQLGYTPPEGIEVPDILEKLFLNAPNQLKGPLIDDRPLSETEQIRAYTAGGDNYIGWLIKAAATSHDALRLQQGFTQRPNALLYLMLHHALDLSFVETSIRLFFNAGLIGETELKAARREPKFFQVEEASLAVPAAAGGSRWRYLHRSDAAVTGTGLRTVGEFIPTVLTSMVATAYLKRQLDALERLKRSPTAVLERVFAEHLDLCTYRFDAWYGGIMSRQLERMRYPHGAGRGTAQPGAPAGEAKTGIYLGAYGWLENVKPEFKKLTAVELPANLAAIFADPDAPPLMRDRSNQGYIHAPSLNQAVTAAVLRNGYLSNATPDNPGSLAVNLSSERVRIALSIIEGMKGEQSLGALLGYQFERGLHDRHDVEVDGFIYDLRKVFPLVGDRLAPTLTGRLDAFGRRLRINRVEARNVIDGLALVEHIKTSGVSSYPFGHDADLPAASPQQAAAITAEAARIADIADAVADLAMAESVHQVVQGNYDRAGAVLDTYSKGKFPATPDVVRTPRSGVTLTHRVALHLKAGLDPNDGALTSPRAKAEPALNAWLAGILPPPAAVACSVTVTDPLDLSSVTYNVTQADLGLLPIDLLYLLDPDNDPAAKALDDLIEAHVIAVHAPRPDAMLTIAYRERIEAIAGHVPLFELSALVRHLRSLLLRSRPLKASDMAMAGEANEAVDLDAALARERATLPRDLLAARLADLDAFRTALQARLDAKQEAQIATEIEQTITGFVSVMQGLGPFAALQTGTGAVYADRRRIFSQLHAVLAGYIARWTRQLAEFDARILAYDADSGAPDAAKFLALRVAEKLIATTATDPLPAQPDDFRDDLMSGKRAAFVGQRAVLIMLYDNASDLAALHDGIEASKAANAAFDAAAIDIAAQRTAIVALAEDMAKRTAALALELTTRLPAIQARLDQYDAAAEAKNKIEALTAAAKLLFGEDFKIVPDFGLPAAQAGEWSNAWGAGAQADEAILGFLKTTIGRRFPLDDWFTGVARVRSKLHDLEASQHLADAFTGAGVALQALQFPHRPELPWLGLEFPETDADGKPFVIDEDKLLYTAHFAESFDPARRQLGLLLDEWTEVIPRPTEDTGLAFHFDRPNAEPPQTLLLALPPKFVGSWQWQDLVDTVRETMDLAKKRAIEPDHVDTTAYARFLPALVSAVAFHPITASLNFAFNNNLAAVLAETETGNG